MPRAWLAFPRAGLLWKEEGRNFTSSCCLAAGPGATSPQRVRERWPATGTRWRFPAAAALAAGQPGARSLLPAAPCLFSRPSSSSARPEQGTRAPCSKTNVFFPRIIQIHRPALPGPRTYKRCGSRAVVSATGNLLVRPAFIETSILRGSE